MRNHRQILALLGIAAFTALSSLGWAQNLGTAATFAVLGATTVTNTGPTIVTGDLGLSPGTSVTGFPPGTRTGALQVANAAALQAQNDTTTAYNALAGAPCTSTLTGDLGGRTLVAGVYCFSSSAQLTGTLTLDAQGDPNAVFIFQIGSTLTTASAARVLVVNGGRACNVFWQVGSSATLGTGTAFVGSILALTSITMTTGATIAGRLLARNGAVTLDSNSITVCSAAATCPAITVGPATLPAGTVGVAYAQTVTATGGTAPPNGFAVASGTLPPGLTLNPTTGAISGTPTTAGPFTFTIGASDTSGCGGTSAFTVGIAVTSLEPRQVPTLSEWTMILLAMILAGLGLGAIRRRGR
jgi:hypothetical protein